PSGQTGTRQQATPSRSSSSQQEHSPNQRRYLPCYGVPWVGTGKAGSHSGMSLRNRLNRARSVKTGKVGKSLHMDSHPPACRHSPAAFTRHLSLFSSSA
ncbi:uncharacterized protein CCOS01_05156, partial [Colletotrichum costaricense]